MGFDGAEPGESEKQNGCPHLPSKTLTLVLTPEPRSCVDGSQRREALGQEVLNPDENTINHHGSVEAPVIGTPGGPSRPPPLE